MLNGRFLVPVLSCGVPAADQPPWPYPLMLPLSPRRASHLRSGTLDDEDPIESLSRSPLEQGVSPEGRTMAQLRAEAQQLERDMTVGMRKLRSPSDTGPGTVPLGVAGSSEVPGGAFPHSSHPMESSKGTGVRRCLCVSFCTHHRAHRPPLAHSSEPCTFLCRSFARPQRLSAASPFASGRRSSRWLLSSTRRLRGRQSGLFQLGPSFTSHRRSLARPSSSGASKAYDGV